ncbi:helix-turn-helix domain-containing protein [Seonamhaeicola sp.]|uniref:helix-turn-helix domain-containing protein n=1 Tax=Seonamhaeicola sp. TaxID=1912245 RepID=UPI003561E180
MRKEIRVEDILNAVCRYFSLNARDIFTTTRKADLVEARHFYFYMARRYTRLSMEKIGTVPLNYGKEKPYDHSTVLHGIKKIDNLIDTYRDYKEIAIELNSTIEYYTDNNIIVENIDLLQICLDNQLKKAS